jgi:cell division protein FtsB
MKTDVDTREQARRRTTGTAAPRPAQAPPAPRQQPARQHPPGRRPAGLPPGPPRPAQGAAATGTRPAGTARPASGKTAPGRTAPGKTATGPARTAPGRTATSKTATGTQPAAPRRAPAARPAGQTRTGGSRMPFMLLVLSLLGGGLVCLLIVNTTLSTAQFNITKLQQRNAQLSQQQQTLQQQIATDEAPGTIEKRAFQLGMREQQRLTFLNVGNGRIYRQPSHMAGEPNVLPVPGFTP